MLRFSERHAGKFGICYVGVDEDGPPRAKHYLVANGDTAGATRTLPDFLLDKPHFGHILQLLAAEDGTFQFTRTPKFDALSPFAAKRTAPPPKGYEPLANTQPGVSTPTVM